MLDLWDLIYGPQDAIPHGPNSFDVPCYVDAKDTFENVKMWLGKVIDELYSICLAHINIYI